MCVSGCECLTSGPAGTWSFLTCNLSNRLHPSPVHIRPSFGSWSPVSWIPVVLVLVPCARLTSTTLLQLSYIGNHSQTTLSETKVFLPLLGQHIIAFVLQYKCLYLTVPYCTVLTATPCDFANARPLCNVITPLLKPSTKRVLERSGATLSINSRQLRNPSASCWTQTAFCV